MTGRTERNSAHNSKTRYDVIWFFQHIYSFSTSIVSAHCASLMSRWPLLRGEGVWFCISLLGTGPLFRPAEREFPLFFIAFKTISGGSEIPNYQVDAPYVCSFPLKNPGRHELFNESCYYFYVAREWFGGKCDGLIWRGFPLRDLIMLYRREGLHLCEHDSTVRVHFCQ